ncbi:metal-dependent hydrolase [endosymbiont of Pachyrhynchus infernalis]|uniref:metal-dependent hydrolase n=1 Tax=endosymbiont of Pachyrhynchus infernalis TaxID=1971488 RepID=UPI000DC7010D|nr:metal-dependent hydrolase [endosymbiont of Pachyrhynchus infernalis]BBA84869.1 uncharacterized protein NARPIN1_01370 [endosymbiont of Pachyrhynchus infernalis]
MNIDNHIIFNVISIFILRNINFISISYKDWFYILLGSLLTCMLPDIDHPCSFIGRRFRIISKFIYNIFGHRKITHSLLMILIINFIFKKLILNLNLIPYYIYHGMVIGYINHIIADMFTVSGVPLLWPINIKFKIPLLYKIFYKFNIIIIYILILLILIIKFIFLRKNYN